MANLQLKHVLIKRGRERIENALKTLPTELSTAYKDVLDRIRSTDDEEAGGAAIRTLTWILHAARPLRMHELRVALDVEEGRLDLGDEPQFTPGDIIEMCQSLVVHEESSGVVRFVHPTVQDFLKSLNFPNINLAKTCLAYLQYNAFDNICSDNESMQIRLRTYKFCRYAVQFWGFHVRGAAEELSDIRHTVLQLLSSEHKRNFILQTGAYLGSSWNPLSFTEGQNALHIIATNGLAVICRQYLDIKPKHERYSSSADEVDP